MQSKKGKLKEHEDTVHVAEIASSHNIRTGLYAESAPMQNFSKEDNYSTTSALVDLSSFTIFNLTFGLLADQIFSFKL